MRSNDSRRSHSRTIRAAALAALMLAASGCAEPAPSGVVELSDDPALADALAATGPAVSLSIGSNGINQNGINQNGINQNGINQNGITLSGLTTTGLSTTAFTTWFNANPVLAEVFMRYTYRCAAPAGTTVTWKNSKTRVTYSWAGSLGLAAGWTAGKPATLAEQQVVTACLGALANKYGVSITLAVEGRTATGTQLAIGPGELTTFSYREGCFFGNLFNGTGLFVGLDHTAFDSKVSSARACALDRQVLGPSLECPAFYFAGSCPKICTPDQTNTFYETCTFNGVAYKPITTRLKPTDVYSCGDGTCQFTESCGSGADWSNCKPDCGECL
jgi:hypothetical protein